MQNMQKLTLLLLKLASSLSSADSRSIFETISQQLLQFLSFLPEPVSTIGTYHNLRQKQWTVNQNQNARAIYFARQSKNLKTWEDCAAVKVVLQPGFTVQTAAAAAAWAELCSQASWC